MRPRISASRSGIASSSEVTPNQRDPSCSRALAHSTAPCPYASAFTIAQTFTPAPTCCCTRRKFFRRVVSDTSAHVGRVAVRFAISVVATWFDYSGGGRRSQVTAVLRLFWRIHCKGRWHLRLQGCAVLCSFRVARGEISRAHGLGFGVS